MFDPSEHRPRGFNGRPFVALLTAVGAGLSVYYVSRWLRLSQITAFLIIAAIILAVGLAWYRIERPK
jgi:hypothetical protein